ncbi:MAG: 5-bromo-4-chloroindolyl phosphate hydrolysis family protein [Oscillospiraceae bacterium]|nr:5-bromo-4-chloroindolyl phosphate hydrolysis family protein [Oscillospiraceae bacterium]
MSDAPKQKNGWLIWAAIIAAFFFGLWPVALALLAYQIYRIGREKRGAAQPRHPYDIQRQRAERAKAAGEQPSGESQTAAGQRAAPEGQAAPKTEQGGPAASAKPATPPAGQSRRDWRWMVWAGGILSGIFLIAFVSALTDYISWAAWAGWLNDEFSGVITLALFLLASLTLLGAGLRKRRWQRQLAYLRYIGDNRQVSLAQMAAAFGTPVNRLCRDIRRLWKAGLLPQGYLDMAAGTLVLGRREPPKEPDPPPPQDEQSVLTQIRRVNDAIADSVMSAKISRIEEITGRILDYQRQNPDKAGQLRSFLNYYLPTTLKILQAYAQLEAQGVEGENISAAKGRIEGMMDKVVEGFEAQLDRLFQDSAMDIAADVAVLEKMLEKDGLSSSGQNLTL